MSEFANRDPVITDPGTMNNDVMDDILLVLTVTDPDGDDVAVTVSGLPTGLSWDGSSVTGNPMIPGTYEVTIEASDGVGGFASEDFSWVISGALYLPFGDVGAGHPFANEITWMYAEGISFGCGDGTIYCPSSPVTRGQIASFFAQAFGLVGGVGSNLFDDDDGSVHEDNIDKLADSEITLGCGFRDFCSSSTLNRGQLAALLFRALTEY